jgi:quercetin dioxygenase-like cupin family protein
MARPSVAGLMLLAVLTLEAAQSYPPPFPRSGATKLLENDRVVVWDVTWPKGQATALHRHPYDMTGVYIEPGDRVITAVDGSKRPVTTAAGGIVWQKRGLTHIEEGTSEHPLRAIMIELKQAEPVGTDASPDLPPAFPRDTAKQLLDNERVRVWENTWPPGQPGPLHRHVRDNVVVWMADGTLRSTPKDGEPTVRDVKKLTVTYSARGNVHREEAIAGAPRAYVFELK